MGPARGHRPNSALRDGAPRYHGGVPPDRRLWVPSLRLGQKLVLAFGVVLLVVVALVGWTLVATDRLSGEMRTIGRQSVPAVRLEVTLLDTVFALRRLEARYLLFRDSAYLGLFQERALAMERDLQRLGVFLRTAAEHAALAEARRYLADYRAVVDRRATVAPDAHPAQLLEGALERLYAASEVEFERQLESAERLNERTRLIAFGGLGVTLLVGLGITLFVTLRIARPLRTLEAATRDVAERAFSQPIPVRGGDEVAQLTRAFNQMAAKLRDLDAVKDEFFSAVSHDLRTPLSAITWSAELLQRGKSGTLTTRQARLVEGIQLSSTRLLGLVNQILELGRLQAGKLRLELSSTDLRGLVEAAAEEIRPLAEQGDLTVEVGIPDGVPPLVADGARLQQVLVNLLGNAIRFTPPGGRISVAVEPSGSDVVIRVADTGVGIPPDRLSQIFERYAQGHAGRGGSGIGLAVVRGIVEAHGGRVWAESEEGRGSCFTVRLPRRAQAA
ncbi:MAG: hypothetical protein DMD79_11765 [Candidatus Rokuibacteriota bacterium]|nr:MAG: hypothetical protein DMD79_11765 [Candidatus Rokubacteria bacterium]